MVDLGGGHDGPLEHGFSNSVFILPGIIVVSLTEKKNKMAEEQAPLQPNIGAVIGEKIAESVQNMNVLETMQKIVDTDPDTQDPEAINVKNKLKEIMEKYSSMSDDEKAIFQNKVKDTLKSKLSMKLQDGFSDVQQNIESAIFYRLTWLAIGAFVLIVLFVFFGYKLYKSIKDKEVKREEKRKAKLMKKKK